MRDSELRKFLGVYKWNIMCVPKKINGESPGLLQDILNRIESLEKYLGIKYVEKPDNSSYPKHKTDGGDE
jgi:hypothetical protein